MLNTFTFYYQLDEMDCGPTCIRMISSFYGKDYSIQYLRDNSYINKTGVSLLGISQLAEFIGMESKSLMLTIDDLLKINKFPCVLHWNQNHFVVLYKITKKLFSNQRVFHIADPAHGRIKLSEEKFKRAWLFENKMGVALFLELTEVFCEKNPPQKKEMTAKFLYQYLKPYRKQFFYMFLLLMVGSGLTLVFPFLTEALIDRGVNAKDINFIFLILLAQLGVFLGSITIEIIRNWLMLYVGTRLSITIISEFLKKMLQLPIKFFDSKMIGDIHQRIEDNERIERFLTSQSLMTFFSIITFSVFFGVLWYYDVKILISYLILTLLSVSWSFFWFRKRKKLDYVSFQHRSRNQESILEILSGVTEMKLNQFENYKIGEWKNIQEKLFKINIKILKLDQIQLSGFNFLNQFKNIIVTFLAATYVVQDKMTLGALLSVSYIIGQMNSPVNQLVSFFRSLQDAKLSLERLNEIQNHPPEEKNTLISLPSIIGAEVKKGIKLENVSFQYEGPKSPFVLKDISLFIPKGKITAIVGASGSGKTTLMKLLLRFYEPVNGKIYYNNTDIINLSPKSIRKEVGVVMQEGYIFSDTIEKNITMGDEHIDLHKLNQSVEIANIKKFIDKLPLNYKTKIGESGVALSGGQKQRVLIARAVYKNPQFLFFDEATSSLDAENEKKIHDELQIFFKGKTVLIIAHRLSTVKKAHQIIVLKDGEIIERGNHEQLVKNKFEYYNLVKNQLELGN